jgi:transposase
MSGRFWLDDDAWAVIEPLLPKNQPGARRVDDRRVISGIMQVLRSGCLWRDCPREYVRAPPSTTVSIVGPGAESGSGCWWRWSKPGGSAEASPSTAAT